MTSPPAALPSWIDGELIAPGAPAIPAEDQGFLLGLAVYETLRCEDGRYLFVERHLERLRIGLSALSIPWPLPQEPTAALEAYARHLPKGVFAVRLTVSRGVAGEGPRLVIGARAHQPWPEPGVRLVIARHPKTSNVAIEGLKTSSRVRNVLAREEAAAQGAWDALIATTEGDISEATISNLWVVRGGAYLTPGIDRGCLAGITRSLLAMGLCERGADVREGRVTVSDLASADELFLSGSVARVVPVIEIPGVVEGLPGSRGAGFRAAERCLHELEERDRAGRASR